MSDGYWDGVDKRGTRLSLQMPFYLSDNGIDTTSTILVFMLNLHGFGSCMHGTF